VTISIPATHTLTRTHTHTHIIIISFSIHSDGKIKLEVFDWNLVSAGKFLACADLDYMSTDKGFRLHKAQMRVIKLHDKIPSAASSLGTLELRYTVKYSDLCYYCYAIPDNRSRKCVSCSRSI